MHLKHFIYLGLILPELSLARELRYRQTVSCSFSTAASSGDTCQSFTEAWGLTLDQFMSLNPSVNCPNLETGQSYCVVGTVSSSTSTSASTTKPPPPPPTITSTKTVSTTTSTKPGNGITTPTPIQPDMVSNCNAFYFVKQNERCADIVSQYGISLTDFLTWNPKVGNDCTGLWANTYACVSIIGYVPTPTNPGNGIQTPVPTQPGMTSHCDKFQFIKNGDTCVDIASQNGISVQDFLQWNPQVGGSCTGLWANAYACVGVVSFVLKSYYHLDCTGNVHNNVNIAHGSDGICIDTGCAAGSVNVDAVGRCPGDQVQISYWENAGCSGKWFGYGYMSRGQCHRLWSDGYKFKALHLRCAREQDDCVNKNTCTYDLEPSNRSCWAEMTIEGVITSVRCLENGYNFR